MMEIHLCTFRNHFKQLSTYRYRLQNDNSLSSNCSSESDNTNKKSNEEDLKGFGSGLKRSQAFHTAELLQQQVSKLSLLRQMTQVRETFSCLSTRRRNISLKRMRMRALTIPTTPSAKTPRPLAALSAGILPRWRGH